MADDDPPRPEVLLETIRFRASETSCVILGDHARERMDERGIVDIDVFRVLRTGRLKGDIRAGRRAGEWIVKLAANLRGSREIGVVTAVLLKDDLFVLTVEWEDWR